LLNRHAEKFYLELLNKTVSTFFIMVCADVEMTICHS
jgi:hypothetical protein